MSPQRYLRTVNSHKTVSYSKTGGEHATGAEGGQEAATVQSAHKLPPGTKLGLLSPTQAETDFDNFNC